MNLQRTICDCRERRQLLVLENKAQGGRIEFDGSLHVCDDVAHTVKRRDGPANRAGGRMWRKRTHRMPSLADDRNCIGSWPGGRRKSWSGKSLRAMRLVATF